MYFSVGQDARLERPCHGGVGRPYTLETDNLYEDMTTHTPTQQKLERIHVRDASLEGIWRALARTGPRLHFASVFTGVDESRTGATVSGHGPSFGDLRAEHVVPV
jgi:hypothetical protein